VLLGNAALEDSARLVDVMQPPAWPPRRRGCGSASPGYSGGGAAGSRCWAQMVLPTGV
jgi:hypothetical protein